MTINPANVRVWSMIGQRGVFGMALLELAKENDKIIALAADLCNTAGLDRFKDQFPHRMFNVGIAEQNMIGVAAGLAASGKIPFAATFANFAALRACESVRHFMGYMGENVKLVGFGSGFAMGMFGTTHYALEDIAALRSINNLVILSPADGLSVVKAVSAAVAYRGPVYLRLGGIMNNPVVYREDFDFQIGKAVKLRSGSDVSLIATGTMVAEAVKAAERLSTQGVSANVFDFPTIKPLDASALDEASAPGLVVTVEEHSKVGGLGGAVAEALAGRTDVELQILGTGSEYIHAGSYDYMRRQHGLTSDLIAERVFNLTKKGNK